MKKLDKRPYVIQARFVYYLTFFATFQFFCYVVQVKYAEKKVADSSSGFMLDDIEMSRMKIYNSPATRKCFGDRPFINYETTEQYTRSVEILTTEPYMSYALVFILSSNDHSEEASIVTYAQYDWAKFYTVPPTFWGDILFFTDILPNLLTESNYKTGWIGSMPGNNRKGAIVDSDVVWMQRMLTDPILIQKGFDLLTFSDSTDDTQRYDESQEFHLIWKPVKDLIFEHTGEKHRNMTSTAVNQALLSMGISFTARPELIQQFIDWISDVLYFMKSDTRVLQILSQQQSCESLKRTTQRFIYEFLVPYFFSSRATKIMDMINYKTLKRCAGFLKKEQTANQINDGIKSILSSGINNTSSMLFVLCHNKNTCDYAGEQFSGYSWGGNLFFMPSTNLLETYFYTNILGNLIETMDDNIKWVGSISWKAPKKTFVDIIDRMISDQNLIDEGVDILGFWTPYAFDPHICNSTMYIHTNMVHEGLIDFMEYILTGIGESNEQIALIRQPYPTFKSFYGSYFVARPSLMRQYISWIQRVMVFLGKDPYARASIWADSKYNGDQSVPMRVYGVPFYPLHPFVGERLLQYFFNTRTSKIVLLMEYAYDDIESYYSGYQCPLWFDVSYYSYYEI